MALCYCHHFFADAYLFSSLYFDMRVLHAFLHFAAADYLFIDYADADTLSLLRCFHFLLLYFHIHYFRSCRAAAYTCRCRYRLLVC